MIARWIGQSPMRENGANPEETARLRYTYMDAVTRLVQEGFSEQIDSCGHSQCLEVTYEP